MLVGVAALALMSGAHRGLANEPEVAFVDSNSDGWDDRWCARYPGINVTKPLDDTDGDGVPDFFEMATNQNPYAAKAPIHWAAPTAQELAETQRKRELRWERVRAALTPYVNRGLRDFEGNPITRADRLENNRVRLSRLKKKLQAQAQEREKRIEAYLRGPGRRLSASKVKSLIDVVDGEPQFVSGLSHTQADQMEIIRLWPGWNNGPDLTGTGTAVAMWDLGGVNTNHEQFSNGSSTVVAPDKVMPGQSTGRVYNIDVANDINEHATAVATIIVGAGDTTVASPGNTGYWPITPREHARGMAYEGGVRVYGQFNDTTEMCDMAELTLAGTLDIVFSNHAYGTTCGWLLPASQPDPNGQWEWYGDPSLGETSPGAGDGKEDYQFGFYSLRSQLIDDVVHTCDIYLPVWAAGNSGSNITNIQAPELQSRGPSDQTHPHIVMLTGEIYDEDSGTPYPWPPRRLPNDFPHGLIPEACAKNVLTVTDTTGTGSSGPTDDWRMKPEIKAYATNNAVSDQWSCALDGGTSGYRNFRGSSFSAAGVTGGLALLRQEWQQLNGSSHHVLASTWKAIILSAAIESAGYEMPSTGGEEGYFRTIDFDRAHGLIARNARVNEFGAHSVIKEIILEDGGTVEFKVVEDDTYPSGEFGFGVTVCWTDPAGTPPTKSLNPTDAMLVNDIDVRVTSDTTGTEYFPYYVTNAEGRVEQGDNTRDNVEHIYVPSATGEFTVKITHKGSLQNQLPQTVSVVLGDAVAVAPIFEILNMNQTGIDAYLLSWASAVGGVYQVDASSDLVTWTPLPGEVVANTEITSYPIDASMAGDTHFYRVRQTF